MQDLQPMSEQLQKASKSLLQNTENFLGMWAVVSRSFPGAQEGKDEPLEASTQALARTGKSDVSSDEPKVFEEECLESEAKRQMFQTAESAVEAWAMLATSLGGQSFVKSEFEKICFVENRRTDTEVSSSSRKPRMYTRKYDESHVYTPANLEIVAISLP